MAGVIDQLDALMVSALQSNVFSDTNQYTDVVANGKSPELLSKATPSQGNIRAQGPSSFERGNLYDDRAFAIGGQYAPLAAATPVANYIDIFSVAHWLRNIGTEFGVFAGKNPEDRGKRLAKFATYAGMFLLAGGMNPGDLQLGGVTNQIANPLSFVAASIPFVRATPIGSSPNLAAATGQDYVTNFRLVPAGAERLVAMRSGLYVKAIDLSQVSKLEIQPPGFIGDVAGTPGYGQSGDTLQKPGLGLPAVDVISNQVDGGVIADLKLADKVHTNLYHSERKYSEAPALPQSLFEKMVVEEGQNPSEIHASKLFHRRKFPSGGSVSLEQGYSYVVRGQFPEFEPWSPEDKEAGPGNVDMRIHINENEATGLVPEGSSIPDNQLYMPFCFQDLRQGINEFLYFRAFLKDAINETFSPEWQSERFYGRVDQIPIYLGTARTIALSFDIVAWGPQDLPLMYKKMHKLQSMVYPMYDSAGFLQSAPIIRMRVGDLFVASSKRGLPGYLTSLDFSYDDGIWNMKTDFKVPRKVTVSLQFNVLHEGNPGVYQSKVVASPSGEALIENIPAFGIAIPLEQLGGPPNTVGALESGVRGVIDNITQTERE